VATARDSRSSRRRCCPTRSTRRSRRVTQAVTAGVPVSARRSRSGSSGFQMNVQCEGGASAARGPAQDRFELGGPLAVPYLGFGSEACDRLLLGEDGAGSRHRPPAGVAEFRTLRWVLLNPGVFVCASARDGLYSVPRSGNRRGSAGIELLHLPGVILPSYYVRMQMAWPPGVRSWPGE
jgi:hypothetical protein